MITYTEKNRETAKLMVVGVGGGGNNAVNQMIKKGVDTVTFVSVNTDNQALQQSRTPIENRIQIGKAKTEGLGAGSDPEIGKMAAEESIEEIKEALQGMHLVFIVCGMGGGTGTGASPIIAKVAKELGALVVGVVTTPFDFEGAKRQANAKKGIEQLSKHVDSMIIIPNNKLITEVAKDKNLTIMEAFEIADDVLRQGITGLSDLIVKPGLINLDFADIKAVLKNQGLAHMGIGSAKGENKIYEAVYQAVRSPLLETCIDGAKGLILNVCGGTDLSLIEVSEATNIVKEVLDKEANIIFGANIDDKMSDEVHVTLIATGFKSAQERAANQEIPSPIFTSKEPIVEKTPTPIVEIIQEENVKEDEKVVEVSPKEVVTEEPKKEEKAMPDFLKMIFGRKKK